MKDYSYIKSMSEVNLIIEIRSDIKEKIKESLKDYTEEDHVYMTYPNNCKRISDMFIKHGFGITSEEAEDIWGERSNNVFASWISLPIDDDELWNQIFYDWVYFQTGKYDFIPNEILAKI